MYCQSSLKQSVDNSKKSAVFIVESDKIVRSNLREHIKRVNKFRLAGEMPYIDSITDELAQVSPNIVIFSSFTGSDEQYMQIKKVHYELPLIKKLVLSKNVDESEFCSTVVAGIKGYCSIDTEISELIKAIEIVSRGGAYYDNSMSNFIYRLISHMNQMRQLPIDKPIEEQIDLTDRELEVISVAATCDDYEDIARTLHISKHTVKMHLTSIYRKLGVKNKLQAILKIQNKIYEFKF